MKAFLRFFLLVGWGNQQELACFCSLPMLYFRSLNAGHRCVK